MLKTITIALCGAGLLGCASPPSGPDLTACRADAARAPGVETLHSSIAFIDDCMARKGWRPNPACAEMMMQGTAFCDYVEAP